MHEARIVYLLVRNPQGVCLTLQGALREGEASSTHSLLPSAKVRVGENDTQALDRAVRDDLGIFLQTQAALEVGYDTEYIPGEGVVTKVLYLLKIPTEFINITLGESFERFSWRQASELRTFEPVLQVLVQTALDFYMPAQFDEG